MIYQVFYTSRSLFGSGNATDHEILSVARARNAATGVTGYLFRTNMAFMQFLEGHEADVRPILRSILDDPRHDQIDIWPAMRIRERQFAGWDMGYANGLADENLAHVARQRLDGVTVDHVRRYLTGLKAA